FLCFAMASSSCSAPSQPYTGKWDYDVFLCFRGDVRLDFMPYLEKAMNAKKIRVFVDTMLSVTEDIGELLRKLERTAVSVVIFSCKFADSPWCLDEVRTIAQSIKKYGHRALPVFYQVDWTTVAGDYRWSDDWKSAFLSCFLPRQTPYAKTIGGLDATKERKKEWMDSLQAVASKTGRTSESFPVATDLVDEVVAQLLTTLASMSSGVEFSDLVGMDSRVSIVEHRLAMEEQKMSRIVGLWGMGGLGKTTLARTCYERLKLLNKDEMKFHFIEKVNETCNKPHLAEGIVLQLYSALLSEKNLTRADIDVGYRRERLSRLKVFLVLDDVQTPRQLEQLLLKHATILTKLFAMGSRVIVTTRNYRVLQYAKAKMYHVQHLNGKESLDLFKMHAFEPDSIQDDHMINLSDRVVSHCTGNPLYLKVLGGTLLHKGEAYWESFLEKLGDIREPEIHDVLRRSYDELENNDKRLFLDVACFFSGTLKSLLVKYMDASYTSAYSSLEDLIDKSLLVSSNVGGETTIGVHSLLRVMAWNIVNDEEDVRKRSRLKDPDDIHKLLTTQEQPNLEKLVLLCLSKSANLQTIPDLSSCSNLEHLLLSGCESLTELPASIESLAKLVTLDASDCQSLTSVPSKISSKFLKQLVLSNCPSLTKAPEVVNSAELQSLDLDRTPIDSLPESTFHKVKQDGTVSLYGTNITHFPFPQTRFEHLKLRHTAIKEIESDHEYGKSKFGRLHLIDNPQIATLPATIWNMVSVELIVQDCPLIPCLPVVSEPRLKYSLTKLQIIGCTSLTEFPSSISNLRNLEVLVFSGTGINSLPSCIGELEQLSYMDLSYSTNLESVPSTIKELGKLSKLVLIGCDRIGPLPEPLPPSLAILKQDSEHRRSPVVAVAPPPPLSRDDEVDETATDLGDGILGS
ncbi:Disease resistance protein RUN1, partial [Linum grandiflorum]